MLYVYRTSREVKYPPILGPASRVPADVRLHFRDTLNRRSYTREEVTGPSRGVKFFLPAIWGGSGVEGVRVAEAEYLVTKDMSEAALEEELGVLRREYWDRTFQVLYLITTLTELWVGRVYPDALYQLAFELLGEFLERRSVEGMIAMDVVQRLGRDSEPAAQLTEEYVQRPWEGCLRVLDGVFEDLMDGRLTERRPSVFGRKPAEREQIFQAFVITCRDAVMYCLWHSIDPSTVIFDTEDIIFDLAGTAGGVQLFQLLTRRRVLPGKLWERAPQWSRKGWSCIASDTSNQRHEWRLDPVWRKGTEYLAYPAYMGESIWEGPAEEPFFPPSMPIRIHREEWMGEDGLVETKYLVGAIVLSPEDVEKCCRGWWGREFKEYFVSFDGEEGWLPREGYGSSPS